MSETIHPWQSGEYCEQLRRENAKMAEENAKLWEINAELLEPLKQYTQRGHHDTCSHALSMEYDCDCGFVAGRAAIAKAEETANDNLAGYLVDAAEEMNKVRTENAKLRGLLQEAARALSMAYPVSISEKGRVRRLCQEAAIAKAEEGK